LKPTGEAEPLIFRAALDPAALLREVPQVGMSMDVSMDVTVDEDEQETIMEVPVVPPGGGFFSGSEEVRWVVREDEPAVGRCRLTPSNPC